MQPETNKTDVNGKQDEASLPQWKPFLSSYWNEELKGLTFPSKEEIHAAIDLLWDRRLGKMPYDFAPGYSLIVPAEGVRYFAEAGLQFTVHNVISPDELTAEEREELRKEREQ